MKKAQITIFAILGIVLVLSIALLLVRVTTNVDDSFSLQGNTLEEKITYVIETCIDTELKLAIDQAYVTSGEIRDFFPRNHIVYDGIRITTSYDRDFISQGLSSNLDFKINMEPRIMNSLRSCMLVFEDDPDIVFDFDIYITELEFFISDLGITVEYEYLFEREDDFEFFEGAVTVNTDLFYLLERAREITNTYLSLIRNSDPLLNMQLCNAIYSELGFKPMYTMDIFDYLASYDDVDVIIREDYFIITLQNKLSFAIKPILITPIC